jgi:hypothetical protein
LATVAFKVIVQCVVKGVRFGISFVTLLHHEW